jgi:SAM-dependent methyltransferase
MQSLKRGFARHIPKPRRKAGDRTPVTKGRDSGMPPQEQWESYFDAPGILDDLFRTSLAGDAVEFGCGYGTFTTALAARLTGTLYALDIDSRMVHATSARASERGLANVIVEERDFVAVGSGRTSGSISAALLFNILHIENPIALLREAHRTLRPGGTVGIIHWVHDVPTPRGPPLSIRPRPQECHAWGIAAGLRWIRKARSWQRF